MKILQINKYPSLKGGTETVLFDTIRLLKNRGHDVLLFSTDEGDIGYTPTFTIPYPKREDSLLYKWKNLSSFFYNRKAASEIERVIKNEKPDIAHIHLYLNSFSVSILPVLKRYNIPIVMTLHEYRQICPSYLLMNRKGSVCEKCIHGNYFNCMFTRCAKGSFPQSFLLTLEMYYRRMLYPTEKYVDRFVCVSDFIFEKHRQFNPSITDKSVIIKNPVSLPEKVNKERGDYILYIGRISQEKGITSLLDCMYDLPQVSLKIAGAGILSGSNFPSNVEFIGFVQRKDITNLIRNAMYVVVSSQWYETFSLSCAESLSLATPVIASRIGALPELVTDGQNGFLFKPGDSDELKVTISKAVSLSDEEYYTMCNAAYESVKSLSGENYISKLLDLYNDLLLNKS